jgi:hypothetical protein
MVMLALMAILVVVPVVIMLLFMFVVVIMIMLVIAFMLFILLWRFQNTLSQFLVVARVIVILMVIIAAAKHSSWVVSLNLDGSVENLIFLSKNICSFFNCNVGLCGPHMRTH